MKPRPRLRLSFRNEALILLPAALVLLITLSIFTLSSYRNALTRLTEERREEAVRLARVAAAALAVAPSPGPTQLRALAPEARAIALLDASGHLLATAGEPPLAPFAAAGGRAVTAPLAVGPDDARSPDAVTAFAPLPDGRIVRFELPAWTLAGQQRAIGLLTTLVAAIAAALLFYVLFFLRHLLAPYETLLERARQMGELPAAPGTAPEDEIDLLLRTFERALRALAAHESPPGDPRREKGRQRAEESRLAESLAQLGEMAAGVAHELRNSLATLAGYLTLLERRPDEAAAADFLAEIRQETDHLGRVLDDFLAFARPGTARPQELSLSALLRRAAADPALAGLAVELAGDLFGEAEVHLHGDPQLLERAVANLLRNAAEAERAAGREGPIEVRVQRDPDPAGGVEIAIADRGPGVPPELKGRLFHPFVTGRPGGVGLGLSVAQRVINLHGGRIRLEDRPGGGTLAVIAFPAERVEQSRYVS